MQKITPCLWFDKNAEEAAKFYVSLFKNSKLGKILRHDEASAAASGMPAGTVLTVEFQLEGQDFLALNGGPMYKFSEAVSFMINCATQDEVDKYWDALSAGGEVQACGWLKDKYGLSWQVTPTILMELLTDKDKTKAARAMNAMLAMTKIDIHTLLKAAEQK